MRRRRLRALLLGALALGTLPLAATPAAAAPSFTLTGQTPWTFVEGAVDFDLTIIDAPLDATVNLTIHSAVLSRSAFDLTLEGEELGAVVYEIDRPVDALPAIGSSERRLTVRLQGSEVGPPEEHAPITQPGVYPVELGLTVADADPITFVTHLVVVGGDTAAPGMGEPLGLAWVWPLDVTPAITSDGALAPSGVAELDDDGRLGRQVSQLAESSIPITVAPGGFTTEQWLDLDLPTTSMFAEILASPNQVLSSGYVPLDLPSLLDAGLDAAANSGLVEGTTALESALGRRVDTRTALAASLDAGAFAMLTDANVDRMVVGDDDLEAIASELTPARPFLLSSGDRSVLAAAADPGLEALLDGDDAPALRAQQLLAALSLVASEAPNRTRGLVVTNPPSWDPDPQFLAAALAGLDGHPLLEPMTLDHYFETVPLETDNGDPLERVLGDDNDPSAPPVDPDAYREAGRRQDAFRSFAGPLSPQLVTGDRALRVALATTWGADSSEAADQLELVDDAVEAFVDQIRIPVGSSITLTARTGSIPLTFVNETGQEVPVRVTLESDKLDFPEGSVHDLALPPRAHTVQFEVETRTPGRFPLTLTVSSPDGEVVVSSARVDVRSTAVSGVGVFLTAGAGVVLAGWWANDLRKRRKRRAAG